MKLVGAPSVEDDARHVVAIGRADLGGGGGLAALELLESGAQAVIAGEGGAASAGSAAAAIGRRRKRADHDQRDQRQDEVFRAELDHRLISASWPQRLARSNSKRF